eukprot:11157090-Lingulodinium_polyedra.AAC.1
MARPPGGAKSDCGRWPRASAGEQPFAVVQFQREDAAAAITGPGPSRSAAARDPNAVSPRLQGRRS